MVVRSGCIVLVKMSGRMVVNSAIFLNYLKIRHVISFCLNVSQFYQICIFSPRLQFMRIVLQSRHQTIRSIRALIQPAGTWIKSTLHSHITTQMILSTSEYGFYTIKVDFATRETKTHTMDCDFKLILFLSFNEKKYKDLNVPVSFFCFFLVMYKILS